MNRPSLVVVSAALALMAVAVPRAHHSFAAEFDREKTITVSGKVAKLEWTNPHARLYVDGTDETGKTQTWDFELGPPNGLMRNGWSRTSLKPGTPVKIQGFRSKTSTVVANARTVALTDGRAVFVGSSFDTNEGQ
jgi:hypothetical protein